jgi:general secretion pathway protein E
METGYAGRTGIHELLIIDEAFQTAVMAGDDAAALKRKAVAAGMRTLQHDAAAKVIQGVTTIEEVLRVVQDSE